MKPIYIIATMLVAILAIACKKGEAPAVNNTPPPAAPKMRVKSDYQYTYQYDDKGRVSQMSASNIILKFYYSDSAVLEAEHFLDGRLAGMKIHKLNGNGMAYSTQDNVNLSNSYSTYEYSPSNRLISRVDTFLLGGVALKFTYYRSNDRIDSIKEVYGTVKNTYIFEYYTDKMNTITNEHRGKFFLGVSDRYPIKRETIRNLNSTSIYNYTYEWDAQNRITKVHVDRGSLPPVDRVYTYY